MTEGAAHWCARERWAAAEARAAQEAAKTEKVIAAFSGLVERLDALAAERGRPWWRRLVG